MRSIAAMQKTPPHRPPSSHSVDDGRAAAAAWINEIMARRRLEEQQIAELSGVHVSTVYRLAKGKHSSTIGTIARIAEALEEPPPSGYAATPPARPGGLQEDAVRYVGDIPNDLTPETPNQSVWTIKSRALELAGLLPGDLARLDQSATARPGDVVVAQIYDFERGTAATRIRVFDGFSLVSRSMDPTLNERALPVDGERVLIMGRIDRVLRRMD